MKNKKKFFTRFVLPVLAISAASLAHFRPAPATSEQEVVTPLPQELATEAEALPAENQPTRFTALSFVQHSAVQQETFRKASAASSISMPLRYLFIGDSRFVGMRDSITTEKDITWVSEVGANHDFYWQNRDMIAAFDKDAVVVYELGVNDLDSDACLAALQDLVNLGFRHIYFSTVAPIDEPRAHAYGYTLTNAQIEQFNDAVIQQMPQGVYTLDSFAYLCQTGIDTPDGLHYEPDTYFNCINYLVEYAK